MKKLAWLAGILFLGAVLFSGAASAVEKGEAEDPRYNKDIVEDPISGPGTISIKTKGDIMMSFGGMLRLIPTSETDWDFGLEDDLHSMAKNAYGGFFYGNLPDNLFKQHANESGFVEENYIRSENRLYFNALPKDRKWSFYAALEWDRPLDVDSVDGRGGDSDDSNFGLERIRGTYQINENLRFNAGWDLWFMPDPCFLTYGDDAPGFWIDGHYDKFDFSVAYLKLEEKNWTDVNIGDDDYFEYADAGDQDDRDVYAGWLQYHLSENHKITGMYHYDKMRDAPTGSFTDALADQMGEEPDTDAHHMALLYEGKTGIFSYFLEGFYIFGSSDSTGLEDDLLWTTDGQIYGEDDYDIESYALAADFSADLSETVGWGFEPHLGLIYTSGDDNPEDDDLEGFVGTVDGLRFTRFGGENTIIGDMNFMHGSTIYGFTPILYGNGTPVMTGGLTNTTGFGFGRGDNPGMTMSSIGFTLKPKRFLIFKTNVNSFWYNEDVMVSSFVNPPQLAGVSGVPGVKTVVDNDYVGTEWDAELTLATTRHTFLKLQGAIYFPGEMMEDLTSARSSYRNPLNPAQIIEGEESDDEAYRLGLEFIWNF